MATQSTAIPKLYIGMDIHKKSWSVHMRTDISDHKTLTIPSNCDVLYEYVDKHFRDHEVSLTYEAGCCGFSASRYFLNLGWNVLVVNPADVPKMDKQNYQKTDKIDCRIMELKFLKNLIIQIAQKPFFNGSNELVGRIKLEKFASTVN